MNLGQREIKGGKVLYMWFTPTEFLANVVCDLSTTRSDLRTQEPGAVPPELLLVWSHKEIETLCSFIFLPLKARPQFRISNLSDLKRILFLIVHAFRKKITTKLTLKKMGNNYITLCNYSTREIFQIFTIYASI